MFSISICKNTTFFLNNILFSSFFEFFFEKGTKTTLTQSSLSRKSHLLLSEIKPQYTTYFHFQKDPKNEKKATQKAKYSRHNHKTIKKFKLQTNDLQTFFKKYFVISKKVSTFAPLFERK